VSLVNLLRSRGRRAPARSWSAFCRWHGYRRPAFRHRRSRRGQSFLSMRSRFDPAQPAQLQNRVGPAHQAIGPENHVMNPAATGVLQHSRLRTDYPTTSAPRPLTGWPEAVGRLRLPRNAACGFPRTRPFGRGLHGTAKAWSFRYGRARRGRCSGLRASIRRGSPPRCSTKRKRHTWSRLPGFGSHRAFAAIGSSPIVMTGGSSLCATLLFCMERRILPLDGAHACFERVSLR